VSLNTRLDDLVLVEATQLHLFLSIIILMLLLRFFGVTPELFDVALFSCISMPASYALTYYHARIYRAGKYVVRKTPESLRLWSYETTALLMSFMMGYMVFIALSGSTDIVAYAAAFIAVQTMRIAILIVARNLKNLGVDIQHPVVVTLISVFTAAVALVGLTFFFSAIT